MFTFDSQLAPGIENGISVLFFHITVVTAMSRKWSELLKKPVLRQHASLRNLTSSLDWCDSLVNETERLILEKRTWTARANASFSTWWMQHFRRLAVPPGDAALLPSPLRETDRWFLGCWDMTFQSTWSGVTIIFVHVKSSKERKTIMCSWEVLKLAYKNKGKGI